MGARGPRPHAGDHVGTSRPRARRKPRPAPASASADHAPLAALPTALILAAGAVLRLVYFTELRATAFGPHLFGDSAHYLGAARRSFGALLSHPAFLSPLYPSVLHALRGHADLARAVQMAAGLLTAWLVGDLARRLVSRRAGYVAVAVAALYPAFVFFEGEILPASLALLAEVAAMWLLVRRRPLALLLGGACLAVGALLSPPFITVALAAIVWAAVATGGHARARVRLASAALVAAGVVAPILPHAIATLAVSREFSPLSTSGGVNLWIGNGPDATGTFHVSPSDSLSAETEGLVRSMTEVAARARGRPTTESEASAWWASRTLRHVAAEPAAEARVLAKKLGLLVNRVEGPSQTDFSYVRGLCPALRVPLPFLAILAAGVAGLLLARPAGGAGPAGPGGFLWWMIAGAAIAPLAAFVTARHRLPLVPPLMIGAGAAVDGALAWIPARRAARAAALAGIAAVVAAIGSFPLGSARGDRPRMLALEAAGEMERGHVEAATRRLEEARTLAPRDPVVLTNLGAAYQRTGRLREAIDPLAAAVALSPGTPLPAYDLGLVYFRLGRTDSAAAYLDRAVRAGAGPEAMRLLAAVERAQGHLDRVESLLRQVLTQAPNDVDARSDLGALLLERGRIDDASVELARVVSLGPRSAGPYLNLGVAYVARGRFAAAIPLFERAAALAPGDRMVAGALAEARSRVGDRAGAAQALRTYLAAAGHDPEVERTLASLEARAR